ncbi:uncharacterized protein [Blastocystis hominis]|uniref:Uncharacterized protein n=1 Tax=Blastocystis hominis TaxID=12968 RepID=D8M9I8_BLAHO|nr:uncharacterized protein [Blastocystis hominis]CBK24727.2 unnamed protein product [Blastocystis hominis]|eukprot:XP_012898775.1 uncharacterized protein [Blastocystis hominis]
MYVVRKRISQPRNWTIAWQTMTRFWSWNRRSRSTRANAGNWRSGSKNGTRS